VTLLLFPLGLALALATPVTVAAAPAKPGVRKATKRKPARGKRVLIERRVAPVKNNLPNVQALGSLVVDLDGGQEIFSRKADQPRAIASISKLAAGLVVMDRGLELEGLTTIKRVDAEVARGGAPSRLLEGMTLSNRDLLHAAMLGSDNRAVAAMGRAVGLTSGQFAEAMTKKMVQLGLKQTRFREPTGLSPENVSTPREVIRLLRAAMAHPTLGPVLRRMEYDAHPVGRAPIHYVNTHRPAHRSNTAVLGGKTGYNDAARYCLVIAARVDGRSYGMAFLGTEGKMTRFGDAARVADWLVAHKPRSAPAATGTMLAKTDQGEPRPAAPPAEPPPANDNGVPANTAVVAKP
jgi:D-alanyl-D-alanine endopeptidase (penicillin-binding protein 7)